MLSVWCADRSVSPLRYCVAAIGRETEISSNLIKHGVENKQLFRQHTLQASMHHNSEALLGYCTRLPVSLCMCVCVMLSAFRMKHCSNQTEQCRGSLGQRRTLVHLTFTMCPTDTCAHIQRAHWLCRAVHRKPFIRHT